MTKATFALRSLLVVALLAIRLTSYAEVPKEIGTSSFTLVFDENSHGLWGGSQMFILPNGTIYARLIRPPVGKENGMQERRHKTQLSANELQGLRTILDRHQFLAMTIPKKSGVPDEAYTIISLKLPSQETHEVSKWERNRHTGFEAICQYLLGIVARSEKTQPIYKGPFVDSWVPTGFVC